VAEDLKVDSSVDLKKLNQAEQVAVLMRRVTELEKRSDPLILMHYFVCNFVACSVVKLESESILIWPSGWNIGNGSVICSVCVMTYFLGKHGKDAEIFITDEYYLPGMV